MWFGTDWAVSKYDGKSFTNYRVKDGLSGGGVNEYWRTETAISGLALEGECVNLTAMHLRIILKMRDCPITSSWTQ